MVAWDGKISKKSTPTGNRTQILGFKVRCPHRWTIEVKLIFIKKSLVYIHRSKKRFLIIKIIQNQHFRPYPDPKKLELTPILLPRTPGNKSRKHSFSVTGLVLVFGVEVVAEWSCSDLHNPHNLIHNTLLPNRHLGSQSHHLALPAFVAQAQMSSGSYWPSHQPVR